jgi:hypothetical protein
MGEARSGGAEKGPIWRLGRAVSTETPEAGTGRRSVGERLDYIAEMAQELKVMSAQAGCRTLAGLLELAHLEALQRRRAR